LKVNIENFDFIVGSVYGPNENNCEFFADLNAGIGSLGGENLLLGGDWNATWDPRTAADNIDTINMVSIPSKFRTEKIRQIANTYNLTDPFRMLHPLKKEFTYIPNARINLNRSRIDYFLISEGLIPKVVSSTIESGLSSTSFDHKKIKLYLGLP
jgi:exonuclease III